MDNPKTYVIEYPDKDMVVYLTDDGESQKVMTGSPEASHLMADDFRKDGHEIVFLTSHIEKSEDREEGLRRWRTLSGEEIDRQKSIDAMRACSVT